jgi:serine/threonine-protein kinase
MSPDTPTPGDAGARDATDTLPRAIGRYEIRRELGRGMMGIVYEALDPALGRTIALKTIQLTFSLKPEERETFEQRFLVEARTAARLSHPGIVVVHDVGRDPETGMLYMALEHLKGRTLGEILREATLTDLREGLRIIGRIADALHHAHSEKVIHRDIKPANIMILPSGGAKDHGLRHRQDRDGPHQADDGG